jgi:hypothetical protein
LTTLALAQTVAGFSDPKHNRQFSSYHWYSSLEHPMP